MTTRLLPNPHLEDEHEPEREYLPQYHVVVYNCDCHTFDDVIRGFVRIIGMGAQRAEQLAWHIHRHGEAVVVTVNQEVAELYAHRLRTETISRWGTMLRAAVVPAR